MYRLRPYIQYINTLYVGIEFITCILDIVVTFPSPLILIIPLLLLLIIVTTTMALSVAMVVVLGVEIIVEKKKLSSRILHLYTM